MIPPKGAVKSIEEFQSLIDKAHTEGINIPIWRLYPMGSQGENITGLIKRQLTPESAINMTRGVIHRVVNHHDLRIDVLIGVVGDDAHSKSFWYFTNYWQAWAYLQHVLEKQRKAA